MKVIKGIIFSLLLVIYFFTSAISSFAYENIDLIKEKLTAKYANAVPTQWGENVEGVRNSIATTQKVIALTFDACGQGGLSNGFDKELIDYLVKENIPATLFISGGWIDANREAFIELSKIPLFTIESHGYKHKPLSINGKSAYGVRGTQSIEEVIEEILLNEKKIVEVTGRKPKYFRSGTAYYDEIAVKIAKDLGYEVINYNVLGDAGATFKKNQIINSALRSSPGSIILYHMNRPQSEITEGIKEVIPMLRDMGYTFVKLEDYHKKLSPRTEEELRRQEALRIALNKWRSFRSNKRSIFHRAYNKFIEIKGGI